MKYLHHSLWIILYQSINGRSQSITFLGVIKNLAETLFQLSPDITFKYASPELGLVHHDQHHHFPSQDTSNLNLNIDQVLEHSIQPCFTSFSFSSNVTGSVCSRILHTCFQHWISHCHKFGNDILEIFKLCISRLYLYYSMLFIFIIAHSARHKLSTWTKVSYSKHGSWKILQVVKIN